MNSTSLNIKLEPIQLNEEKTKKEFRSNDCQNALKMWDDYYPKIGFHFPWIGYFIKLEDEIVGSCAFTGPPAGNKVEVSYWTFKQHEGKGIGTAACRKLISITLAEDPAIEITAKTMPEKNASSTILERCGFTFSGIVQDHEIGDAWEWKFINNKH